MKKKLTLTIEESLKDRAKRFANKSGKSISEMVEQFLESLTEKEDVFQPRPESWTESMKGVAKYKGVGDKQIKEQEVLKKYG
ncbi:MAG: DUF6364 family protein [Balneolaceae bacterium]